MQGSIAQLSAGQLERLHRARILDAVTIVVAEQGYPATSVSDITDHGGFSRKTFYGHFPNKAQAYFAAYDRAIAAAINRMCFACSPAEDPATRVHAGICELLHQVEQRPHWARLVAEAPATAAITGHRDRHLHPLVPWLERVRERLGLAPLLAPGEQATVVLSLLHQRLNAGTGAVEELMQTLYRVIAGTDAPPPPTRAHVPLPGDPVRLGRIAQGPADHELADLIVDALADHDTAALRALIDHLSRNGHRMLLELAEAGLRGGPQGALRLLGAARTEGDLAPQARQLLARLEHHPDSSGRELQAALGIRHDSQLSRLLADLQARGLVAQGRKDGRTKRWQLTPAGREAARR